METAFPIRTYSHKELAQCYGCSGRTFKRWIQHLESELGPHGRLYYPRQVKIIFERLGEPVIS